MLKLAVKIKKKKKVGNQDCAMHPGVPCKVEILLPVHRQENEAQGGWDWPSVTQARRARLGAEPENSLLPLGVCLFWGVLADKAFEVCGQGDRTGMEGPRGAH